MRWRTPASDEAAAAMFDIETRNDAGVTLQNNLVSDRKVIWIFVPHLRMLKL